jgi:hypothetical protein
VKWSAALVALLTFAVVTVTSTVPAAPPGDSAVIEVGPLTANRRAALPPKLTALAPVKFVPVIVTEVPPAGDPPFGLTAVTVGGTGETVRLNVAIAAALLASVTVTV